MSRGVILTVGNGMMGDDAAGPLLARLIRGAPLEGWEVVDGGEMPENWLGRLEALAPEQVLVVDAADMDLAPGEIRQIDEHRIESAFLMTTHSLPLTFLLQAIREFAPKVDLIGIQPEVVAFGYPLSPAVRRAVEKVYNGLRQNRWEWETL